MPKSGKPLCNADVTAPKPPFEKFLQAGGMAQLVKDRLILKYKRSSCVVGHVSKQEVIAMVEIDLEMFSSPDSIYPRRSQQVPAEGP